MESCRNAHTATSYVKKGVVSKVVVAFSNAEAGTEKSNTTKGLETFLNQIAVVKHSVSHHAAAYPQISVTWAVSKGTFHNPESQIFQAPPALRV